MPWTAEMTRHIPNPSFDATVITSDRIRVVVVDDNIDAAESMAILLRCSGHDVRTAYDGLAAIALAQTFRPNVVLSDIGLPKIDGYELARRLHTQFPKMHLIAISGYGRESDIQQSKEAGYELHFLKPVDPSRIHELLANLTAADEEAENQQSSALDDRIFAIAS
jgi:CheY-like chemotaxis protein